MSSQIQHIIEEERRQAAADRSQLLAQITSLINTQAEVQESRLANKASLIREGLADSNKTLKSSTAEYSEGMDSWADKEAQLLDNITSSRDLLKTKLKDDWTVS